MKNNCVEQNRQIRVTILAVFVIMGLCCLNIRKLDYIALLNDEFGYWAHAISAAGYDWKELIAETPYYSWGYSIWLVPIAAFLPTPEMWYKAAILLNVLFLIASYFLCCKSGERIFPQVSKQLISFVSLAVIVYPSNIVYAQFAWSETLQYFLMWIVTYCIVRLNEKFSYRFFGGAIFVLIYMYAVHARNIGIIVVGVFCLGILLVKHQRKIWNYIFLLLALISGYFFIDVVKQHQINALWMNSSASGINNVGIDKQTVTAYSNRIVNSFTSIFQSLGGKLVYLVIGSGLTFSVVIIEFLSENIQSLKQKKKIFDYNVVQWWTVMSILIMWGECALQMCDWKSRKDMIVYARYMENAMGPVLFLGIMYIIINAYKSRVGLYVSLGIVGLGILPLRFCVLNANGGFSRQCSPVIGAFIQMTGNEKTAFFLLTVSIIGIGSGMLLSCFIAKNRIKVRAGIVIPILFLFFCVTGYWCAKSGVGGRQYYDAHTCYIKSEISDKWSDLEIYFIKNTEVSAMSFEPKFLQFLIPERTIHVITREKLTEFVEQSNQKVIIMVLPEDEPVVSYMDCDEDSCVVADTSMLRVYVTNGNTNIEQ